MAKKYVRNPEELKVLRKSYETVAIAKSQEEFNNPHSQQAYRKGFMEAVDMYVRPKNRCEEEFEKGSLLSEEV